MNADVAGSDRGSSPIRNFWGLWLLLALTFLAVAPNALAARGVVGKFGSQGSGDGQLGSAFGGGAYGVDVYEATGDVYVADTGNLRIVRFDSDGNFERAFGWGVADGSDEFQVCASGCGVAQPGDAGGQFSGAGPTSMAIDQSDGSVYILDIGNYRIQKFDLDGNFEFALGWGVADGSAELQVCTSGCQAGIAGSGNGQLGNDPTSIQIAVDPTTGHLLVPDPQNQRVEEFDSSGSFVRSFGTFPENQPQAVAVDSNGTIYTAESYPPRVQKFTPNGGNLEQNDFIPDAAVSYLAGVTVDRGSNHPILITQNPENGYMRAQEFDASGNLVDQYLGALNTYSIPGLAFDSATGRGYAVTGGSFVYVIDEIGTPVVTIAPASQITATGATLNGTVNSQGAPPAHYHFEYSVEGSGEWVSTADSIAPADSADHQVSAQVAPIAGLEPNTTYRFRLVAVKPDNDQVVSAEETFTTGIAGPIVETVGSPYRTTTTARLDARLNPRGSATTYRFEYGLTSAYGQSAPATEADGGSGLRSVLVSQWVEGLAPNTTYHYRLVASNASGTTVGDDMTVTTRTSDTLSHGHLPGPPNSDRNYELVSAVDQGGNGVESGYAYSDDGNRMIYGLPGGTPETESGSGYTQLYAHRTDSGWINGGWTNDRLWPARQESLVDNWGLPQGRSDLSKLVAEGLTATGRSLWELSPGAAPRKIFEYDNSVAGGFHQVSGDASRTIVLMRGTQDPDHPAADQNEELYDVSSGTPRMVSLLPDESVPSCGLARAGLFGLPPNSIREMHLISEDGTRLFFPTAGNDCAPTYPGGQPEAHTIQLYMRDIPAGLTTQLSGPALSGPECYASFIKSTPTAAYFWTQARLVAEDEAPAACHGQIGEPDGDVYRYDFAGGGLECLTCAVPGGAADVQIAQASVSAGASSVAVADDGSRVYFVSPKRLVPGEGASGDPNLYRLDIGSGDLKYVAPSAGMAGNDAHSGQAMNSNASVIVFPGNSSRLNELTDSDNGGFTQYYRYDDRDGSLVCASCPEEGAGKTSPHEWLVMEGQDGPNARPLSEDGDLVFYTPGALVSADQNTPPAGKSDRAGIDVYEWRDGRLLLVTDGKTTWGGPFFSPPSATGITPDGKDIFFTAGAQYTPDAEDSFKRLYDARIGGGFEFPVPPPPCGLEVCQGEAKGAPPVPEAASEETYGPGNLKPCKRHRHRRHKRRHHRHHHHHGSGKHSAKAGNHGGGK